MAYKYFLRTVISIQKHLIRYKQSLSVRLVIISVKVGMRRRYRVNVDLIVSCDVRVIVDRLLLLRPRRCAASTLAHQGSHG